VTEGTNSDGSQWKCSKVGKVEDENRRWERERQTKGQREREIR
jgi:hypothetical protein